MVPLNLNEHRDAIVEVLERADYRVRVAKHGDGIIIKTPANELFGAKVEGETYHFAVLRGNGGIVVKATTCEDYVLPVRDFAVRAVLVAHVLSLAEDIAFPLPLIESRYDDGSPARNVVDLLVAPTDPDDLERENEFDLLFGEARESGFSPELKEEAERLGMLPEYEICQMVLSGV